MVLKNNTQKETTKETSTPEHTNSKSLKSFITSDEFLTAVKKAFDKSRENYGIEIGFFIFRNLADGSIACTDLTSEKRDDETDLYMHTSDFTRKIKKVAKVHEIIGAFRLHSNESPIPSLRDFKHSCAYLLKRDKGQMNLTEFVGSVDGIDRITLFAYQVTNPDNLVTRLNSLENALENITGLYRDQREKLLSATVEDLARFGIKAVVVNVKSYLIDRSEILEFERVFGELYRLKRD